MPGGIESDRSAAIDHRLIASIGQGGPEAPAAVTDFMAAFRNGFITVDDLNRRTRANINETAETKTNIAAQDLKQRQIAELGPGEIALEQRKQQMANSELGVKEAMGPALLATAKQRNQDALDYLDPNKRNDLTARTMREELEEAYTRQYLELPATVEVGKPKTPESREVWLEKQISTAESEVVNIRTEHLAGSPEDQAERAKLLDFRLAQIKNTAREEYDKYKDSVLKEPNTASRGTLEYYQILSKRLEEAKELGRVKAAYYDKALPTVIEAQAKAQFTPPTLEKVPFSGRYNEKTDRDEQGVAFVDPRTAKVVNEAVVGSSIPKTTESQDNARIYSERLEFNNAVLGGLELKGFDPASAKTTAQRWLLPNRWTSNQYQQFESAQRNWIAALLRRESGAAISRLEFDRAGKEYFARDGDTPDTLKQKNALRELVETEMRNISGPRGVAENSRRSLYAKAAKINDPNSGFKSKDLVIVGEPGFTAAAAPPAATATAPVSDADVGKPVTINGVTGILVRNPDGTFSLK